MKYVNINTESLRKNLNRRVCTNVAIVWVQLVAVPVSVIKVHSNFAADSEEVLWDEEPVSVAMVCICCEMEEMRRVQ